MSGVDAALCGRSRVAQRTRQFALFEATEDDRVCNSRRLQSEAQLKGV